MDAYYEPFDLLQPKLSLSFTITTICWKSKEQITQETYGREHFIDQQLHEKKKKNYCDLPNNMVICYRKLQLEPILSWILNLSIPRLLGNLCTSGFYNGPHCFFESMEVFEKAIRDTVHEVNLFHVSHNRIDRSIGEPTYRRFRH